MSDLRVRTSGPLAGMVRVPGDKSVSHRAVMLSAIAPGTTRISGLLFSDDVLATAGAFRALGVSITENRTAGELIVEGRDPGGFVSPAAPLDLGNSGTSMRLLAGLFAGVPGLKVELVGDPSLSARPMKRVVDPLTLMGALVRPADAGTAPLLISGRRLRGIRYRMPVASAQVKSALLLAGLFADGETRVAEPGPTRDHTELMLPSFGVPVIQDQEWVGVSGSAALSPAGAIEVPGDFSSAAFLIVAALLVPDSEITVARVGVNPTRTGLLDILYRMGARIALVNRKDLGREPVADVVVKTGRLRAADVSGGLVTRAIDELPVLAVAAARAEGTTRIREAAELRVKESDRIAATARMLKSMGARVTEYADGLDIEGPCELTGAEVEAGLDHRIAMAAAVAGLVAKGETVVRGAETIGTSFPDFEAGLTALAR